MKDFGETKIRWILGLMGGGCYAGLLGLDLATESDDISLAAFSVDALTLLLTIASAVGVALLVQRMHRQHEEKLSLMRDLDIARIEGEEWRAKTHSHLNGIRIEMDKQFVDRGMTAAERDVALLILKGLSHKEVASLRGTAEATVRQQARSIYSKAKLPGKTAFSAYFLEDLWGPADGGINNNASHMSLN